LRSDAIPADLTSGRFLRGILPHVHEGIDNMAQRVEHHPLEAAFAALLANGLDGAGEALRILVNEASKIERAQFLNAQPHERSSGRTDYANGFKPKTVMTRVGELTFDVPQTRGGGFYPSALEKGSRTEQALNIALAEMYVQGVSTRKVITVLQSLLGPEASISSTQVSRAAEQLDAGLAAWRERPLDETPYVFLDARYERVREGGRLIDCAVLAAVGVTSDGQRRVLGVSVALSEAEVHWRAFHCTHGVIDFLHWHRWYLSYFEKICGALIGKPNFALAYWNWEEATSNVPNPFFDQQLLNVTYWKDPSNAQSDHWGPGRVTTIGVRGIARGQTMLSMPSYSRNFTRSELFSQFHAQQAIGDKRPNRLRDIHQRDIHQPARGRTSWQRSSRRGAHVQPVVRSYEQRPVISRSGLLATSLQHRPHMGGVGSCPECFV
jgi:hypothetical protein